MPLSSNAKGSCRLTRSAQTAGAKDAHAAAALGRPAWLLLEHVPYWRWRGAAGRWYSTARQFRQHRPGDWGGAIDDIAVALKA